MHKMSTVRKELCSCSSVCPNLNVQTTAKYIKKFKGYVSKWVQWYKQFKNVDDLPDRDIIRTITEKQIKAIGNLLKKKRP